MATPCAAAKCRVRAVSAVQWITVRGTRAEPVCEGHRLALAPLVGRHAGLARFLTLGEYAARLAREQTTVRVTPADAFADLMGAAFDAGASRFPPPA